MGQRMHGEATSNINMLGFDQQGGLLGLAEDLASRFDQCVIVEGVWIDEEGEVMASLIGSDGLQAVLTNVTPSKTDSFGWRIETLEN